MEIWSFVLLAALGCLALAGLVYALRLRALLGDTRTQIEALASYNTELLNTLERDDLTAAYSRNKLFSIIENDERTQSIHVLCIDLDNLGSVNDGHGTDTSDRLLAAISSRLIELVGDTGTVARTGGDEFCVVLNTPDLKEAQLTAVRIAMVIANTSVPSGEIMVSRSASIGLAPMHPEQKLINALILAEDALALAKIEGRNRVKTADAELLKSRTKRASRPTIEEIQTGLNRDEVTYYVQPIWDIHAGKPVGVEALIRWVTPEGDIRLPESFVDTMSDAYHLDLKFPLEAASRTANAFTQEPHGMFCAFNVSNSFLERSNELNPKWINKLLHGIPPERMIFEIVESAVIQDPEGTKRIFQALRDAGVRVALDDFGKGLSNLQRLQEFPVDIVKIDRHFITDLHNNARNTGILDGLMEMSRTLNFEIIAEGVETEAQLETVRTSGIHLVQGYLLGRPAPVEEWLKRLS